MRVLAQAIEGAGHRIIYCNVKSAISTSERVGILKHPWSAPALAVRQLKTWRALIQEAKRINLDQVDAVIIGYLGVLDVHLARRYLHKPLILDQMAPLAGTAEDRSLPFASLLKHLDNWANQAADLILVDTVRHLPSRRTHKEKTRVVPVGAPRAWFEAGSNRASTPKSGPLSVCFFGLFTPLQGAATIGRAAQLLRHRDDIAWTFIGHGQDRPKVESLTADLTQVTWLDWVDAGHLPELVASHDVCLGIFGDTAKSRRVIPNKVYQGAAAGCAVVTSDTELQREVLQDAALLMPAAEPTALAAAIEKLADDRAFLAKMQQAAKHRALSTFTPDKIGEVICPIIDEALKHNQAAG